MIHLYTMYSIVYILYRYNMYSIDSHAPYDLYCNMYDLYSDSHIVTLLIHIE